MVRSVYRFHVYYHIRRILKILQIPLAYDNTFHKYSNPYIYSREMFMKICSECGVSNELMKWRNQGYFTTWQSKAWETGRPDTSYINDDSFSRWIIEKSDGLTKAQRGYFHIRRSGGGLAKNFASEIHVGAPNFASKNIGDRYPKFCPLNFRCKTPTVPKIDSFPIFASCSDRTPQIFPLIW